MGEPNCLFCKIAGKELESQIVFEDDQAIAFRDINPQAPVHLLVVPRKHIPSLVEAETHDEALLGHLFLVAQKLAEGENLNRNGYRVVLNTGSYAGQTVPHVHLHLLGGRSFGWPPG